MTLTEIKSSLFGYNKNEVCRYITELNTLHEAKCAELDSKNKEEADAFANEKEALNAEISFLKEKDEAANKELAALEERVAQLESENKSLEDKYLALKQEAGDLKSRSELISTAILNAEKCAGKLIDDATAKSNNIVCDAKEKVKAETKKLSVAKQYLSQVRVAVAAAMRNIDSTLANAEENIDIKTDAINSGEAVKERENSVVKDKVSFFKRA